MAVNPGTTITINGITYDTSQLPPQAQPLIALLLELQGQMKQIETRKTIVQLAQQQLLSQLNPMLPAPQPQANAPVVLGRPSAEIPVTPTQKPAAEPSPFPETIPPEIRAT
jgi:hypothetical protein